MPRTQCPLLFRIGTAPLGTSCTQYHGPLCRSSTHYVYAVLRTPRTVRLLSLSHPPSLSAITTGGGRRTLRASALPSAQLFDGHDGVDELRLQRQRHRLALDGSSE